MVNLIVLFLMLLLSGCIFEDSNDGFNSPALIPQLNPELPDNYNIIISTIDEDGEPFQSRSLEWGFISENAANKFNLECEYDTCSQWELGFEVEGDIELRAWGYIDDGKYCSRHFEGIKQVNSNPSVKQIIELEVLYFATACE